MKTLIKHLLACVVTFYGLNSAIAQSSNVRKEAVKIEAIKTIVNSMHYVFIANFANPLGGGQRALTSEYDLAVSNDTITAYLPYFGRAYVAPINPTDGGIKFKSTKFFYKLKENKKGGWDVVIRPKETNGDMKDVQSLRLNIGSSGYASLQVISANRDPISFNGYIESREKK
jgi:hypothetical protein